MGIKIPDISMYTYTTPCTEHSGVEINWNTCSHAVTVPDYVQLIFNNEGIKSRNDT